ncbi:MAG: hypothetical protein JW849_03875 [Phycisphaerae bacterium]|nr:hypothetical protein [Phycisphaerae bacterium]
MPPSKILKKSETNPAGKRRLNAAPPTETFSDAPSTPAQAKILSQADGHVLIQVVCSCGKEIQLRCATGAATENKKH